MAEWQKTNQPPDDKGVLGFWVRSDTHLITRNCYIYQGQWIVYEFDGDIVPSPCPDYWKEIDDEPDWMEDDGM